MRDSRTAPCFFLFVLIASFLLLPSCGKNGENRSQPPFTILERHITQPVDHNDPDGPTFRQEVHILTPEGVPHDAPVFFNLGNEQDLQKEDLLRLYELHGNDKPIVYAQAEHRGYGQSLTNADQTVPSYVRIEQAMADAHEAIQQLKKEYPGPWMAAGWSYGGGLVINFAAEYPDDVEVILSSSGVVDWPFLNYSYAQQVRFTMGENCYERLVAHVRNLKPEHTFDDRWVEREFLYATVAGVTQMGRLKKLQPYFRLATFLPTSAFLRVLRWTDKKYGDGEAWSYAQSMRTRTVTSDEIAGGLHNWRTWRYQQCTETGVFFASEDNGLYAQTLSDFYDECEGLFGEAPQYASAHEWSPRDMLANLAVPLIYVSGGMDPWFALGLEPDFPIHSGRYFYIPEGQHCPDRDDPALARRILKEMLSYVESGQ